MNINISELKEARKVISKQILDNMDLQGTDYYYHLCLAANEIDWILMFLEKGKDPKKLEDYD